MGRDVAKRPNRQALSGRSTRHSSWWPPVLLDLAAVLVFVLVGRLSHSEDADPAGLGRTAWPFLAGLAGGYVGLALTRWPVRSLAGGALVAAKTVVLGLVIRYVVEDGVPLSFAIVTAVVLGALFMGWRVAVTRGVVRI